MKINKFVLLFLFSFMVILMISVSGCTQQQVASYTPKVIPQAELHVTPLTAEQKWSVGLGCYWVASGTAYNSGNAQASNAVAIINMIDTSTGSIRDTKSISVGSLMPGASQTFQTTLDGECNHNYRLQYSIS
jgi:uncharacterized membrane protein YciS (DUF1049 family)